MIELIQKHGMHKQWNTIWLLNAEEQFFFKWKNVYEKVLMKKVTKQKIQ